MAFGAASLFHALLAPPFLICGEAFWQGGVWESVPPRLLSSFPVCAGLPGQLVDAIIWERITKKVGGLFKCQNCGNPGSWRVEEEEIGNPFKDYQSLHQQARGETLLWDKSTEINRAVALAVLLRLEFIACLCINIENRT